MSEYFSNPDIEPARDDELTLFPRLVVLESGLGLESGLESVLRGLGLGLGLELEGLGLGLGLELEGLGLGLGLDDSGLDLLSSPYGSPAKKNSRAL